MSQVGWTYDEYVQCPDLAGRLHSRILDLEDLLTEARDFIDHRPHHARSRNPSTPCCDLERRIDDALSDE